VLSDVSNHFAAGVSKVMIAEAQRSFVRFAMDESTNVIGPHEAMKTHGIILGQVVEECLGQERMIKISIMSPAPEEPLVCRKAGRGEHRSARPAPLGNGDGSRSLMCSDLGG